MTGRTDFITESCWEDIFTLWYVVVDDAYQALQARYGPWRRRGPAPVFSDSEVITVALIIDTWFGGDEAKGLSFLRQYHRALFPRLLSCGAFNARRRSLGLITEQIRRRVLAAYQLIDPADRLRLLDSAPIYLCAYGRAARNETASGPEYVGYVASDQARFLGYRLQTTVSHSQVIDAWLLTPAARKDGKMMTALLSEEHDLNLLADGAYTDPGEQALLRRSRAIVVWAVPRRDTRQPWPAPFKRLVRRVRLRIETAFSVLVKVFNIKHPGSRSLSGLITRIATRLLAYTLCFITAPLAEANGL